VPLPPEFAEVYNAAVAAAKFPAGTAPTITRTIGALRRRATKKMQSDDVKIEEQGFADQAMADKLEAAFAERLSALGDEAAFKAYQDARQSLAKIHDIESSTRAGQVDVQKIFKRDEKFPDRMTGRTKMLADIGENFPDVARTATGPGGRDVPTDARTFAGGLRDLGSAMVRGLPGLDRYLNVGSDAFQNRLGAPASEVRRTYFDDYGRQPPEAPAVPAAAAEGVPFEPTPGVVPSKSLDLGRGIELAPDDVPNAQILPETPDMLTADVVPPVRGDIDFKRSQLDEFAAADEFGDANGLEPVSPGEQRVGNAADLRLVDLGDEFELDIRSGTQGAVGERELAELLAGQKAGDLDVMPPREMEQLDLGAVIEQPRRLKLDPPPGTTRGGKTKERGFVRVRDPYENNASGDSSASAEAISRVRQEKAAGQDRFIIDLDDTVRPLTGVDAVDARAKKGQVIVQKGVGKDEYTVLDRGGLTADRAKGRIQAAFTKRE
jgi:hypothetical protein